MRHMGLNSSALGCPGSGNIQFQRRMSSLKKKNRWYTWEEILSYSHRRKPGFPGTHFSPFSTWLSALFFFTSLGGENHTVRAGLWVLLVVAVILPSQLPYLDTWSGFEAAKTAPLPSRGLHHFGKFLEPSDEWAGRGYCCFLMRWHSWAFLADQEWASELPTPIILLYCNHSDVLWEDWSI